METIRVTDKQMRLVGKGLGEFFANCYTMPNDSFCFAYHDNGSFSITAALLLHTGPKIMDYLRAELKIGCDDTLPTLADEVAKTICDTNTKEAFKKFANLLIEKVENK